MYSPLNELEDTGDRLSKKKTETITKCPPQAQTADPTNSKISEAIKKLESGKKFSSPRPDEKVQKEQIFDSLAKGKKLRMSFPDHDSASEPRQRTHESGEETVK